MNTPNSIDCSAAAEQLYAYLDGELTPEVEAAVRTHLESCAPCFQLLGFEESYLAFLRARAQARHAPEHLKKRIFEQVLFDRGAADPE
ncbi:MAG: mycothiol system anti-sigma-R factor [Gemmatimonadota bacterium]|nr:MAG: mycothiol system anti-sigma-R factor [Gemmatimonadota bacterium]